MTSLINFKTLNQSVQPTFWAAFGAILVATIVVPALTSIGKIVAAKIEEKK